MTCEPGGGESDTALARRPRQIYRCAALGELARQLLRFAPPEKRIEQVFRAEKLHDEIEPDATYPYEYIAYRITGYRGEHGDETLLVGAAVQPDLRLLIDTLSRSVAIPVEEGDQYETVPQLAARLNVSTKTISRWREAGLRWRWVQPAGDTPRQLVFPRDAVERFLTKHSERVERAARFSQMTPAQRRELIEHARAMMRERDELTLNQVATRLARQTGRAVETIRLLLEQHDRRRPDQAIFVNHTGPLTTRQQRIAARAYRMGIPVSKIAQRFRRSSSTIYRAIHQRRAAELRRRTINYIFVPFFERPNAEELIHAIRDQHLRDSRFPMPPVNDLPDSVRERYVQQPMTDAERQHLFLRYNYLKYKAATKRDQLDRYEPRANDLKAIEDWLRDAEEIRQRLHAAHRTVVLSVARRHLVGQPDQSMTHLLELLERGESILAEAIETYSVTRRDFIGYLTNRLMQGFVAYTAGRGRGQAAVSGATRD